MWLVSGGGDVTVPGGFILMQAPLKFWDSFIELPVDCTCLRVPDQERT